MLRVFKESPEFGSFTKVDSELGRLDEITAAEFQSFLAMDALERSEPSRGVLRIETANAVIFTGETPETHTRFPRRVYFQITRNCNLACPTCFIRAAEGQPHVSTSAVLRMAEFLGRNGLVEVRLTGGEPTLHPDFFGILHRFREQGVFVSVSTNGVMNQRTLDQLCEERNIWIICSIDGMRATHNIYRSDSFGTVFRNMKLLKKRNPSIRLRLNTVLTKDNRTQMRDLCGMCKSLDAESITVIPLRPQVRDPRILARMVSAAEFRQAIEDLIAASEDLGVQFTTTLETDYGAKILHDPVFRKRSSCAAGREGTNLDYDSIKGEFVLYGCSYSPAVDFGADAAIRKPFVAGTFSEDQPEQFMDIWRDDSRWTLFRDLSVKSQDCLECSYFAEHKCVGSCPIQNVDFGAIDSDENVLEQMKRQIAMTGEWYCYKKVGA